MEALNGEPASPERRVARNTLLLVAQRVFVTIVGIGVMAMLARHLGPDDFGLFEYAMAFAGTFTMVAGFGLRAVTVRTVAAQAEPDGRYLGAMLLLRLALAAVATGGLLVTSVFAVAADRREALYVAAVGLPLTALAAFALDVFAGLERFDVEAKSHVVVRLVTAAGALVPVLCDGPLLVIVAVYTSGSLVSAAATWWFFRRARLPLSPRWSWPLTRSELRQGLPFAGTAIVSMLTWEVNPLLLGELADLGAVGEFAAGTKVAGPLETIPAALGLALSPALTRSLASRTPSPLLGRALFALATLALPVGVGGALVADGTVALLYGDRYAGAVEVMRAVMAVMPLEMLSIVVFYALGAVHRQRFALAIMAVTAVINLGLATLLVPRLGAMGCAWSAVASSAFAWAASLVAIAPGQRLLVPLHRYARLVGATGAMALAVIAARALVPAHSAALVVWVGAGGAVYLAAFVVLRVAPLRATLAMLRGRVAESP